MSAAGTMRIAVQTVTSPAMWRGVAEALAAGRSATLELTVPDEAGEPFVFTHEIEPVPSLVIAGAGHVGGALAGIAAGLGFDLTVVDDRPDLATAARFTGATLVVGDIEKELSPPAAGTYILTS